jgi:putative aldouronate transport system substrate-binding protein
MTAARSNPHGPAVREGRRETADRPSSVNGQRLGARQRAWRDRAFLLMALPGVALLLVFHYLPRKGDGTMVRDWETEEYVAALEFHNKLREAGVIHPGFAGHSTAQAADLFARGSTVLYGDGVGGWRGWVEEAHRPLSQLGALLPLSYDGKNPRYFLSPGLTGVTMFGKDEPAKVKERLAIVNALAAPFGSEESMLLDYGVKGVDYEIEGGEPVITERGLAETKNGFLNIGCRPRVLYSGASPEWAKQQHAWETKVAPAGVADPSVGVYSATATRAGAATQQMNDTIVDVVSGRKTIADFQQAVKNWKSKYGDKIRSELQQGIA